MQSKKKRWVTGPCFLDIQVVQRIVESFVAPPQQHNLTFTRLHDDHDGKREGVLVVALSDDGDMWVNVDGFPRLRFRTPLGGGRSPRTHNALRILAEAIRLDNIADPENA